MSEENTSTMDTLSVSSCSSIRQSKKFYTAMENCLVTRPDNTPPYTSIEARPVYDKDLYGEFWISVHKSPDGMRITWVNHEGYVKRVAPDGTITEWYIRPTIQSIVDNSLAISSEGLFTKFNKDGSIFERARYGEWFWGPQTIECEPYSIEDEEDDGYYSDDNCGCGNDYRCCGWYPPHADLH